jgi:hypothetical protein
MAIPIVSDALEALSRRLSAWRKRLANADVSRSIGGDETERLRRDVDRHMSDMPVVLQGAPGRVGLLDQRMKALRLDPTYLQVSDGDLYRGLQRVCLHCTSWRLCARDLAHGNVQVGLETYCPNGHTIDELLVGDIDAPKPPDKPTT